MALKTSGMSYLSTKLSFAVNSSSLVVLESTDSESIVFLSTTVFNIYHAFTTFHKELESLFLLPVYFVLLLYHKPCLSVDVAGVKSESNS